MNRLHGREVNNNDGILSFNDLRRMPLLWSTMCWRQKTLKLMHETNRQTDSHRTYIVYPLLSFHLCTLNHINLLHSLLLWWLNAPNWKISATRGQMHKTLCKHTVLVRNLHKDTNTNMHYFLQICNAVHTSDQVLYILTLSPYVLYPICHFPHRYLLKSM